VPETDVSFSTQGGPCRPRYGDALVDLRDLSSTKCKTHSERARYISVPVYRLPSRVRTGLEAVKLIPGRVRASLSLCLSLSLGNFAVPIRAYFVFNSGRAGGYFGVLFIK